MVRRRLSILETMRCLVLESRAFNPADVGTDGDVDHFWVDLCDGTDRGHRPGPLLTLSPRQLLGVRILNREATGAFSGSKKLARHFGRPTLDGGNGIQKGSLVRANLADRLC